MRKVEFRTWIPMEMEPVFPGVGRKPKPGTNCWSDFTGTGLFHQWANAYEEFESGAGNYTVALVEIADGSIKEVLPSNLRFTSRIPIQITNAFAPEELGTKVGRTYDNRTGTVIESRKDEVRVLWDNPDKHRTGTIIRKYLRLL